MSKIVTNKAVDANDIKHNNSTILLGNAKTSIANTPGIELIGAPSYFTIAPKSPPSTAGEVDDYNQRTSKGLVSSSKFGSVVKNKYIIMTLTTEIAGVSKTSLYGGGSRNMRHGIAYRETRRSRQTLGKTMDAYTGQYTTTIDSQLDEFKQLGGTLSDDAARPTIAIPGEFVVHYGTKDSPLLKDYASLV